MDKPPTYAGETTSRFAVGPRTLMPAAEGGAPPRLVVLMGREPGRRYSLDDAAVVIGRGDGSDVQLDDTKVSRRHARMARMEDGSWLLEDLGSRNGTLVNGELVELRTLRLGDRIQLSSETLLLFTRQDPLEDLLLHRQQMEVIGQLAAGIAHDFNNLLNVIGASAAHLDGLGGATRLDDPEALECRVDIHAAVARAAELTSRLLSIARRRERSTSGPADVVDLSELCRDGISLVRRTFDRSIRVEEAIEPGLLIDADRAALHQVLMNLLINARDAMAEGGTVRVAARRELQPRTPSPWNAGPEIVLEVADTGAGMDDATRRRVFEPFFTTKEKGAGNGLGLATVYEVATNHGGLVEVESAPGQGSLFRLRLPYRLQADAPPRSQRKRQLDTWRDREQAPRTQGRVLIVDDQPLVRRSLGRLMRAAGHEVSYASDGREAIDVFETAPDRPEVILLDLDMPNLGGAETLALLRQIDPKVRVVLISGYYDEASKRRLLAEGATDFLSKPVEADRLRDSIRLALQLDEL